MKTTITGEAQTVAQTVSDSQMAECELAGTSLLTHGIMRIEAGPRGYQLHLHAGRDDNMIVTSITSLNKMVV